MSDMTTMEKWQHYLRRKFQEVENAYYPMADELTQKLFDLSADARKDPPDFDIHQFEFIKDWQLGAVSSRYVLNILKTMDMNKVADTQLTRRFKYYMGKKKDPQVDDYVQPCIVMAKDLAVPKYAKYLNMLTSYFVKLVEIDEAQESVTWLEQMYHVDSTVSKKIDDLTLNQVIRRIDNQVIPFNNTRYTVGKNLVCMDENLAKGAFAVHWLFAPQAYIDEIKKQYKIQDIMDIKQESGYIKRLIGDYVNAKI